MKQLKVEIVEKLKLIEEEYIEIDKLKVYCGTFNVNGRICDESLNPWLCLNEISEKSSIGSNVDIYAIGFQELVDLTTTNLLLSSSSVESELAWINAIENELLNENNFKPPTKYVLVDKLKMFGLFLFVYARQSLLENQTIRDVYKSSVATGLMDLVGNKGSVALSIRLHETRLCFVCSHFASDTDKLEKRNSDYRASKQRLKFQDEQQQETNGFDLDEHDFVFWFGDLNYRLDNLALKDAFKYILSSDYERLIKYDQLSLEKGKERAFEMFREGEIKFKPTYKFLVKSDVYEKQSLVSLDDVAIVQGKQKLPSWTDRILWRANNTTLNCTQIEYSSINTITISDHKPVFSLFDVDIKRINREKYDKLYETELKEADRKYNKEMPHIKVSQHDLKFGTDLLFYDVRKELLTITNSGQTRSNVITLFHENLPSSCWITIHPQMKNRLESGASFNIELSTSFSRVLRHVNRMRKLEDFLVVKCTNGNDVFVTVSCTYKPTIIGWSLKSLSRRCKIGNLTFDSSDLSENFEPEIDKYERKMDEIFRDTLKANYSVGIQKFYGLEFATTSVLSSNLDVYKRMVKDLIEKMNFESDPYFGNELSPEYKFLMEHLIERCATIKKPPLDDSSPDTQSSSSNTENNQQSSLTKTTEELKNEALMALSSNQFATELPRLNVDLELLIELLYDLLYSLPHPVVPRRLADLCSRASELGYENAKFLLDFFPRSHSDLFELISKFLAFYIKCFLGESRLLESGLTRLLAEAVFQLPDSQDTNKQGKLVDLNAQNAVKFLNLFVRNYGF